MKSHAEETEEEFNKRLKKRHKKVESLSETELTKLKDKVEKIVSDKTGEVRIRCKLCQKREFRLISTMERHLEDHESGKFDRGGGKCPICNRSFSRFVISSFHYANPYKFTVLFRSRFKFANVSF